MKRSMANKKGFTLIEVVVSVVLITLISAAFLQVLGAFGSITKATVDYNYATFEDSENIDLNVDGEEVTYKIEFTDKTLSDSITEVLEEHTFDKDDKKALKYYKSKD